MKYALNNCFLILILASFGGILGYALGNAWFLNDLEPINTWKSLGAPQGQVIHLLAARDSTVFVETADNKIYSCYRESKYDSDCWNLVDTIPDDLLFQQPFNLQEPIPPIHEKVIDSLVVRYAQPGPSGWPDHVFAYVLIADGSVLQWFNSPIGWFSPHHLFARLIQKKLGGFCFGSLIGPFIFFLWSRPRKITKFP